MKTEVTIKKVRNKIKGQMMNRIKFGKLSSRALLIFGFGLLLSFQTLAEAKPKEKILVVTGSNEDFKKLASAIHKELDGNFEINDIEVNKDSYDDFKKSIEKSSPKIVVLMDNSSLSLGKQYLKETKSGIHMISLMGLNLKKLITKEDKNICGIAYEVPAYTLITKARFSFKDKKINRVLSFYRGSLFSSMFEQEKERLASENIILEGIDIEKSSANKEDFSDYFQNEGMKQVTNSKYDAVFVFLDSGLLNKKYFDSFWLKAASESKIPFLVGAEKLVNPALNFATFGMGPNLDDLADQASQMIVAVSEGTSCSEFGVEDLIGVNSFINKRKIENLKIELNTSAISGSKILE